MTQTARAATHLTEQEAALIAERALSFARADQTRINLSSGTQANTRFASNQITTSGDVANASLTVTSAFGQQLGSATTNRFDDEGLRRVVQTAEQVARLAPADREYLGELGPQSYPDSSGAWSELTANLSAEDRAAAVRQVTEEARSRELFSTGFFTMDAGSNAVATSAGLFAYRRSTAAAFSTTVRTPDRTGSGWAGSSAHDWRTISVREIADRAIEKAILSRNPRRIEPGPWTVILEAEAAGSILGFMFNQLSARSADEGRSYFSIPGGGNRLNEVVADDRVTLTSDPGDSQLWTIPFNSEGLPNERMVWVDRGTLRNLVYDRFWAQRESRQPTGFPSGFRMEGGDATVDEMIASTERGLLVTRFWYMRVVDPRLILYTGLTRDGTFLIENGEIAGSVQNLRWNESPMNVLNNLEMIGRPQRVVWQEDAGVGPAVVVPPLKVREFNFTSVSEAV